MARPCTCKLEHNRAQMYIYTCYINTHCNYPIALYVYRLFPTDNELQLVGLYQKSTLFREREKRGKP